MKKILIHMLIIASAVYISFVFYKTIAIYSQIDTMKKKTALVHTGGYVNKLRVYLEKIEGIKQKYNQTLLYREGLISIRSAPKVDDDDEITYYEIEKCYFSEIEAFENTNKVGISTEKYQRSDFQLFLDIFSYYKNVLFYALFFLNCTFYCYVDSSNKSIKLFCIIYTVIFLFI